MENEKWKRAAARFFLLTKHGSRLVWGAGLTLWETLWEMSAASAADTTTHLPALAAAVSLGKRYGYDSSLFSSKLARYPLPDRLLPKAVPWHDRLVALWEFHRALSDMEWRSAARLALVRLDGCSPPEGHERPSRLPEWLEEARKIANGKWKMKNGKWKLKALDAFAALAAWHPAPRVTTPTAEQLAPDGKGWDMAGQRRWLREFLRSYGPTAGGDEGNNRTVEFMNSFLNSLWTKGCLFFRETTGGRGMGRAEALILGGPGAVFVHPHG